MAVLLYPPPLASPPRPTSKSDSTGSRYSFTMARVSNRPINQVWPGYQRPLDQTELASFAYFDLDGPAQIEIVARKPVESVTVRPLSYGIHPVRHGQTITLHPRPSRSISSSKSTTGTTPCTCSPARPRPGSPTRMIPRSTISAPGSTRPARSS